MPTGTIKHVFPGANTSQGFYSYYDYIIQPSATRIFVIKGGPGVGKSAFMKKIADKMVDNGFNVEFHHCASDPDSLDGIVMPALQIAFIDGTTPHIIDPKNPGCVDEIINLDEYSDKYNMVQKKNEIIECNKAVAKSFQRAYRILKAAKMIYDDWEAVNMEAMDYGLANKKTTSVLNNIFAGLDTIGAGRLRKLFASAVSPKGSVHFLDSVVGSVPQRYVIFGNPGTGKSTLLQKVADTALMKGLDVEAYYCPLDPEKIEHVIIPRLEVSLTTAVFPHTYIPSHTIMSINMNECLNQAIVEKYTEIIYYNKTIFWDLFNKAVAYLAHAKKYHDELEKYYVPNMDFTAIQHIWEKTMSQVLEYTKINRYNARFLANF